MRISEGRRAKRRSIAQALVSPNSGRHPSKLDDAPISADAHDAMDKLWRRGRLHRRQGGYWTYASCPEEVRRPGEHFSLWLPSWYALTVTIRELVERGRARFVENGEAVEYVSSKGDKVDDTESR